jgi:hypothetical protein
MALNGPTALQTATRQPRAEQRSTDAGRSVGRDREPLTALELRQAAERVVAEAWKSRG